MKRRPASHRQGRSATRATSTFDGLPEDYFQFLRDLKDNSNRVWFEANKARYAESVEKPLAAFVEDMAPRLAKISSKFVADPISSLSAVHRDRQQFSGHGAVWFRHVKGKDAHAPVFHVHLSPAEVFYGGGVWSPEPAALFKIRQRISERGDEWLQAKTAAAFDETVYRARGESLTSPPDGFSEDDPHIEDIKRKSFFAMARGDQKQTMSAAFVDDVEAVFRSAAPLVQFLCKALGLSF